MRKKIVIPVVGVVVILAAAGGFFYWWKNVRLTPVDKWDIARISQAKNFTVTDTPDGKLVENKKEGLSFMVPSDWTKASKDNAPDIIFLSPNTRIEENNQILEQGCKIVAAVAEIKTNITILEQQLKEKFSWSSIENAKFEITKIANHNAIRNSFDEIKLKTFFDAGHIPTSRALYDIILESNEQNKENCKTIFEATLKTLAIK